MSSLAAEQSSSVMQRCAHYNHSINMSA